ncbi:large-conductance mechanosensitive channel, partial [Globomyces pollinis-pini]
SVKVVGSVLEDFKEFLNRGNVVDLAVGIVMGAAFTSIVNSGVSDIITPVISLAVGSSLQNTMLIIACPKLADNKTRGVLGKDCQQGDFATIEIAKNRGAVTWNYGSFLQICINFLITSAIVYFMVKVYAATFRREKPPKVRECDFCCKDVPIKAVKCGFCTS